MIISLLLLFFFSFFSSSSLSLSLSLFPSLSLSSFSSILPFFYLLCSPPSPFPPPPPHTHTHKHTQVEERIECVVSGKVRYSKREDKLLALPVPMETATNKSGSATIEQNELGEEGGSRREGEEDHLHCLSSCM